MTIKIPKYDFHIIEQSELYNGFQLNGQSFYMKIGRVVLVNLNVKNGDKGTPGICICKLPYKIAKTSFMYNSCDNNGAIAIDVQGDVSILVDIKDVSISNVNVLLTAYVAE